MKREGAVSGLAVFVFFAAASLAFGIPERQDESEEAQAYSASRTTKTVAGLHFVVEEDRPIEKVGGVYRPIDLDSYVAFKFNKLQAETAERFALQEQMIAQLTERVKALEERLQVLTQASAPPDATRNPQ